MALSRSPANSRGRVREMSYGIFGVILGGRNEPFCVLPVTFHVCTRATPLNRHSRDARIKLARVLNPPVEPQFFIKIVVDALARKNSTRYLFSLIVARPGSNGLFSSPPPFLFPRVANV